MQGLRQAGGYGRMSASNGKARETDWMRTRVAHGLPPNRSVNWGLWYGAYTLEDLELLAAIKKY